MEALRDFTRRYRGGGDELARFARICRVSACATLSGLDRMTGQANLAASVLARLLNRAKTTGDDYQTLLSSYCIERFLGR